MSATPVGGMGAFGPAPAAAALFVCCTDTPTGCADEKMPPLGGAAAEELIGPRKPYEAGQALSAAGVGVAPGAVVAAGVPVAGAACAPTSGAMKPRQPAKRTIPTMAIVGKLHNWNLRNCNFEF